MSKLSNQKLKLLYLMELLLKETDELHPVTIADMITALERQGISAERKSIYDDLETLRVFGIDIVQVRNKSVGYYVASREFELPELKLLVDSVQSSKFITHKKTLSLIEKIERLASRHEAKLLHRQVFVQNRVKTMNESVYYNVDEISTAISQEKRIRFKYFEYNSKKERQFRKNGEKYEVSPFALMWDNENYYMLAFDSLSQNMKHYRVDKMVEIEITDESREGTVEFEKIDMSSYSKKVFSMFAGESNMVRIKFANHLAGTAIDRFGKDVHMSYFDSEHFIVNVTVAVSPQFFAWIFGFGSEVEILSPAEVKEQMRTRLRNVEKLYGSAGG